MICCNVIGIWIQHNSTCESFMCVNGGQVRALAGMATWLAIVIDHTDMPKKNWIPLHSLFWSLLALYSLWVALFKLSLGSLLFWTETQRISGSIGADFGAMVPEVRDLLKLLEPTLQEAAAWGAECRGHLILPSIELYWTILNCLDCLYTSC